MLNDTISEYLGFELSVFYQNYLVKIIHTLIL
jgi:hypothetical protein